jgi:hypothetical protein
MYFVFSVLCECGEELNKSIVILYVHALFHEWLPLLELEKPVAYFSSIDNIDLQHSHDLSIKPNKVRKGEIIEAV